MRKRLSRADLARHSSAQPRYEDLASDWSEGDARLSEALFTDLERQRLLRMAPEERAAHEAMLADLEAVLAADAAAWEAERQRKYGDKKTDEQHDQ